MKDVRPSMGYPFVTRRQVLERLDRDPAFVRECIQILHRRYADRDRLPPPAGWMASHRKLGEEIFVRLASADCTPADVARGATLAKRYAKQLTRILRDERIARRPGLALAAAVFGVRPSEELDDVDDPYVELEGEAVGGHGPASPLAGPYTVDTEPSLGAANEVATNSAVANAAAIDTPPVRRKGRPKGSKNKVKADAQGAKPAKRRRR